MLQVTKENSLEKNMEEAVRYLRRYRRFTKKDREKLAEIGLTPSDVLFEMKGTMTVQEADKIDKTGRC